MNTQNLQNNWSDIKAQIKTKWSKFNDNELDSFKDNLERLSGQIQKTYGVAKEQAEKEFNDFKKSMRTEATPQTTKPTSNMTTQHDAMTSEGGAPADENKVVGIF